MEVDDCVVVAACNSEDSTVNSGKRHWKPKFLLTAGKGAVCVQRVGWMLPKIFRAIMYLCIMVLKPEEPVWLCSVVIEFTAV